MPEENKTSLSGLNRLLSIMESLRDKENGCPWDQEQTMQSLTRFTIEEAYEVVDAIAKGNSDDIRDELGDLLFQIVFYAHIAQEEGEFDFNDVANAISDKLVRRHPHVFSKTIASALSQDELALQWDAIKAQEKAEKRANNASGLLDDVPTGLPALMYAQKLQKKCAKVGFDWPNTLPVLDKVEEEVGEIRQELEAETRSKAAIEEEIGDALFAMVNLARHCNVDADTALRKASQKFANRFSAVEALALDKHQSLEELSLAELEALWCKAKAREKS
ncbi:nucleoside triphosphate pyrophosphohydrolase [Alteromonas sp. MB-3u-76]|uniref:nucleoside triphosphate pyrophosphohydrolase n=1 Tax=Alteromonas sp. MB-3u-76 TaxID=2058133 RepID=UPI000C310338|nr:nucleoside triphosphate pyrophosphohydrolase [Alteromonas sp. MB-3u-76]AUC87404.1 nucleoside triphosphate pyrophosphohydrolase [Alteromonas sp. MB-3u-76]